MTTIKGLSREGLLSLQRADADLSQEHELSRSLVNNFGKITLILYAIKSQCFKDAAKVLEILYIF